MMNDDFMQSYMANMARANGTATETQVNNDGINGINVTNNINGNNIGNRGVNEQGNSSTSNASGAAQNVPGTPLAGKRKMMESMPCLDPLPLNRGGSNPKKAASNSSNTATTVNTAASNFDGGFSEIVIDRSNPNPLFLWDNTNGADNGNGSGNDTANEHTNSNLNFGNGSSTQINTDDAPWMSAMFEPTPIASRDQMKVVDSMPGFSSQMPFPEAMPQSNSTTTSNPNLNLNNMSAGMANNNNNSNNNSMQLNMNSNMNGNMNMGMNMGMGGGIGMGMNMGMGAAGMGGGMNMNMNMNMGAAGMGMNNNMNSASMNNTNNNSNINLMGMHNNVNNNNNMNQNANQAMSMPFSGMPGAAPAIMNPSLAMGMNSGAASNSNAGSSGMPSSNGQGNNDTAAFSSIMGCLTAAGPNISSFGRTGRNLKRRNSANSVVSDCTMNSNSGLDGSNHSTMSYGSAANMADDASAASGISRGSNYYSSTASLVSRVSQYSSSNPRIKASHVEKWNQRYKELQQFVQKHGHSCVPLEYKENPSLSHWVKRQRCQYKLKQSGSPSSMTDDRQFMLEQLGFVWNSHEAAWHEKFQELYFFRQQYKHCNVPSKYAQNPSLAVWVKCQRRQFKLFRQGAKSNISPERISLLEKIGFIFTPREHNKNKYS